LLLPTWTDLVDVQWCGAKTVNFEGFRLCFVLILSIALRIMLTQLYIENDIVFEIVFMATFRAKLLSERVLLLIHVAIFLLKFDFS
jgi:hypothetical protein